MSEYVSGRDLRDAVVRLRNWDVSDPSFAALREVLISEDISSKDLRDAVSKLRNRDVGDPGFAALCEVLASVDSISESIYIYTNTLNILNIRFTELADLIVENDSDKKQFEHRIEKLILAMEGRIAAATRAHMEKIVDERIGPLDQRIDGRLDAAIARKQREFHERGFRTVSKRDEEDELS
jgi:hypothetical protein